MKNYNAILYLDIIVQLILLILLIGTGGSLLFGMGYLSFVFILIQLLVIIWNICSGLFFGITKEDGVRANYILGILLYIVLIILFIDIDILGFFPKGISNIFILFFIVIIPDIGAIWYFNYSLKDSERIKTSTEFMDNILDKDEVLKINNK